MTIDGLVKYATELTSDSSIGGMIALAILAFLGISVLGGALIGLRKGTAKLILTSVITVIAIIASIMLLSMKSEMLVKFYDGQSIKDALLSLQEYNINIVMEEDIAKLLDCFESSVITDIVMVPIAALVLPIVFVVLFIAISILLKIVGFIISLITGFGKGKKGCLSRLLGAVIGAVHGAVIAGVMLFPIAALLGTATSAVTVLREESEDNEGATAVVELYDAYLAKANDSPVIKLINSLGGDQLYTFLAKAEIDSEEADTRETLSLIVKLWTETYDLNGMDWKKLTPENKSAISEMVEQIGSDEFLSRSAAGILRGLAKAINDGVISIQLDDPFDQLITAFIGIFSDSTKDTVGEDLTTFKEVYFILSDGNILLALDEGTDATMNAFIARDSMGETVISRLIKTLRRNERTGVLVEMLARLSVSLMAGELGLDEDVLEKYEGVKDDINGVLSANSASYSTPEEREAAVGAALKATLDNNNVSVSDEIVDEMTDYVINNIDKNVEMSDEVVFDIIFSYYDAYLKAGSN